MYHFEEWSEQDLDKYIHSDGEILPDWIQLHTNLCILANFGISLPKSRKLSKEREPFKIKISEATLCSLILGLLGGSMAGCIVAIECSCPSLLIASLVVIGCMIGATGILRLLIGIGKWLGEHVEID